MNLPLTPKQISRKKIAKLYPTNLQIDIIYHCVLSSFLEGWIMMMRHAYTWEFVSGHCPSFTPPKLSKALLKTLPRALLHTTTQDVEPLPRWARSLRPRPRSCRSRSLRRHNSSPPVLAIPAHQLRRYHHTERSTSRLRKSHCEKDMGRETRTRARAWKRCWWAASHARSVCTRLSLNLEAFSLCVQTKN